LLVVLLITTLAGCLCGSKKKKKKRRAGAKLAALPYLVWNPVNKVDRKKLGVTKYLEAKAYKGINVYKSREEPAAYLMDMNGQKVHKWAIRAAEKSRVDVKHVELNAQGELFAIRQDNGLLKLDWSSNLIWQNHLRFHHDVYLEPDGSLFGITRSIRVIKHAGKDLVILDDYITRVSSEGETGRRISIWDLFGKQVPDRRLDEIARIQAKLKPIPKKMIADGTLFDVFHTNTVEKVEREVPGFARKGDLLISIREIDTVAVVDISGDRARVVWSWGPGVMEAQHQPTLLPSNNLLIFDNGRRRKWTRVIEIEPTTKKTVWHYVGRPRKRFFSAIRGGNERLPNDNILITESDKGHVFEVTRRGEVVWDFWNPRIKRKKNKRRRAAIYRMMRVDREILARLPFDPDKQAKLKQAGYL
jgi:hypothetical protein